MTTLWTRDELVTATHGQLSAEVTVTGISIDTRTIVPGDLFIALVGENSDGHAHIETAFARGATAVMAHAAHGKDDPRILHVANTMDGLQALGHAGRSRFRGTVIGVTGSVGKTTTKDMLRMALSAIGPTHASAASYNNHWGVPLTLARLPRDAAFCVSEIGMNHRGEIAPLAALVQPHAAIITSIGTSHLGHMGSVEAIALEKSDLIAALPAHAPAVVPDDAPGQDRFADAVARSHAKLLRVGTGENATFRITSPHYTAAGSRFTLVGPSLSQTVDIAAPGRHLVRNAASVTALLSALGLDVASATKALADFRPGAGRGQTQPILDGRAQLLDESYNASSLSVRAALETLALLPATRRLAVLGDMLELGAFSEEEHRGLAPDAARAADLVFCSGLAMRALFDALPPEKRGAWALDAASLAPLVQHNLSDGDLVLVKGSLGSRMRDVVTALKNDREAAR
ncbi:UDP-N-acetylmuramoyl-tripeptide--D-alanyl-D-alanine ligase [Neoasaia chiangmaiensis NBRC 101099]|uniref:UDP-N-acetylmuramoyl-tripeptide--D-alanyl-D-alanine ligase n=1 Tax=Neoasaia chiangmaiensis TaxID=320497 RepID=A0A1U9KSX7_9PROT|nr:UDP-N-acetylmuramoyl-tripeptide--D-alanyl-D-alanine ligase [Neoasaia chiangmaiensis]AQS88895.1 UDP-N-acetylmuramoyl-tripeptide--D-alanyl-D-alanine ligase [Neoasaia chiangmaiensis]GBR40466.1 UDP-N-acetylmuramoyl-tripeptide--D-alanyl-D-alanine ligase [Neoasaia chiangmaiensis NBRC 101099]GEN13886.1 UDP-N-acetylmuramoyl-tripeptide--D-alanyl-D-alanine ligase [Neoasaia chiangmaiensis]